jgi:hypothetical protein
MSDHAHGRHDLVRLRQMRRGAGVRVEDDETDWEPYDADMEELCRLADPLRGRARGDGQPVKLRFSDGVEVDISGPPRIVQLNDGLYVIGEGVSIPVATLAEGERIIADMKARHQID